MSDEKISRVHVERVSSEGAFFYEASIGGISAYGESNHEALMRLGAVLYGRLEESRMMVRQLDSIVTPILERLPAEQWPVVEDLHNRPTHYLIRYLDPGWESEADDPSRWKVLTQTDAWDRARIAYRRMITLSPDYRWQLVAVISGTQRVIRDSAVEQAKTVENAQVYEADDEPPTGFTEPTYPGWYAYSNGRQSLIFCLREGGKWSAHSANGSAVDCGWGYIEQALGHENTLDLIPLPVPSPLHSSTSLNR